jgi:hypothetical protein
MEKQSVYFGCSSITLKLIIIENKLIVYILILFDTSVSNKYINIKYNKI